MNISLATLVGFALLAVSVYVRPSPEWQIATYPKVGAIARLNTRTGALEVCMIGAEELARYLKSAGNGVVEEAARTNCFLLNTHGS